ncbi:MAG TPA: hypothetical protein VF604_10020 [Pyrinomonadaceae bacterium]
MNNLNIFGERFLSLSEQSSAPRNVFFILCAFFKAIDFARRLISIYEKSRKAAYCRKDYLAETGAVKERLDGASKISASRFGSSTKRISNPAGN